MRVILKLVLAEFRLHRARVLLTSLAMVAAACVVVWVVSGYDAMVSQFHDSAVKTLGRYDLFVMPASPKTPVLNPDLVEALAKDPMVAEANPVMQARARVSKTGAADRVPMGPGPGPGGPGGAAPAGGAGKPPPRGGPRGFGGPTLVGTDAGEPPTALVEGRWIDARQGADREEAVLSSGAAEQLQVKVGDAVTVMTREGEFELKIIGITEQPAIRAELGRQKGGMPGMSGPATSALYVPRALAEQVTGRDPEVSLVNLRLKPGVTPAAFAAAWAPRLAAAAPAAEAVSEQDVENAMEEGRATRGAKMQAYSATGMSLMAALFIIFTTLSMGVHERIRQFAVLRAVALTRAQVAGMIAVESLFLALIGWAGGLAAGWGLLKVVSGAHPDLFRNGAALGTWCVVLTGASAFGGALLAAIQPAWRATRVSPMDAFAPPRATRPTRLSWTAVVIGVFLIALNPLLVFVIPMADKMRYLIYAAVGCTSMAVGFLLLSPLLILATEKLFGPLLSRLLGLDPRLLTSQLTGNLWRTLGTTVSLTIGLGLFVATLIWGYSMLKPFVPGDWVPDVLVAFQVGGLPDAEIATVQRASGMPAERCLPLAVEQPKLAADITGSEERASVARQDNVVLVGLDPERGLGGADPLLKLTFTEGSLATAMPLLKQGRHCLVPDHFARTTGLGVGGRFKLLPPEHPDQPVEYTIAGVVSLPGWHWMTKFSGLRRRSGRSAALVFAAYDSVRRDFQLEQTNFFWMNFGKDISPEALGTALRPIADRNLGMRQPVNDQGTWAAGANQFGKSLRITTRDGVRERIGQRADGMIWGMCQLPLITLLIASLALVNTVMASVRARRWEMGVLRAVGVTRSGLVRLILAEAVLIGLVACLLSLGFGVMAGWCGTGISQYVSFFGGLNPSLVIPWGRIGLGFAGTLGLCLLAALWPAVMTGRAEPLGLLQAGRASS
ncbi:MAG: FtsX-like permease family protein [Lentisphaeria bacterium]